MKRKSILLSLLLAIFVVGGMFAQEPTYSKMSPYTRILLDKLAKKDTANSLLRSSISGDYLSAFVKVATDEGWASLDSAGCRIRTRTGDIATVLIPPVCRGVGVWAGLYPICISLAADEGQYGLGPLLLGRGGRLCGD
ncbi:hypothetical protein NXW63_15355 [Parabacteroides distasonis]|nr:hypothetical protein [Parabacteroides distasonis]